MENTGLKKDGLNKRGKTEEKRLKTEGKEKERMYERKQREGWTD